jgi:tetratricopeptide (TPR) repeat protein
LYECRDLGEWIPDLNEKIAKTEALVLLSNCDLLNDADERRFYRSPMFTSHYVDKYHFYYTSNYLDSAVMALKAAIETKPQDASLYHELSRVYMDLSHFDSALTVQNKAIALRPDEPIFIANRGYVYLGLGRRDDAISDVKAALEIDSSDCVIYNFLIDLLKESGNTMEIKYWLTKRPKNCE